MHTFRTEGSGAQQTLHEIEDEKIPIYDTKADAEADLVNLAEGQIVGTKDVSTDYESELYNYVDAKLQTTTTEVAMDVFKTGSKAQLNKSGNNVQLRYWAGADASQYNPIERNQNVLIGTIPEGFRPKQQIILNPEQDISNSDNYASAVITINTDGSIFIGISGTNPLSGNFSIQCDYNIDGTNNNFMSVNTLKEAKDYTDEKVAEKVTERNITSTVATSTMDYKTAIKAILDNIDFSTWDVKTYAGKFASNGQAPHQWQGTYQISKASNLPYGITIMGEANNRQFTGIWANATDGWNVAVYSTTINRNIVIPTPASVIGNEFDALLYQVTNADWTFLTSKSIGATATGQFELSGYYFGMYTAVYHGGDFYTVTGSIDWGPGAHPFSAYHDQTAGWKITIGDWQFVSSANSILLLKTASVGNRYKIVFDNARYDHFLDLLNTYGLLNRPAFGIFGQSNTIAIPGNTRYLLDSSAGTSNWPANSVWWFQGTHIFHNPDTASAIWYFESNDSQTVSRYNLWGIDWSQSRCWGMLEIYS